jgi:hypothetical protein
MHWDNNSKFQKQNSNLKNTADERRPYAPGIRGATPCAGDNGIFISNHNTPRLVDRFFSLQKIVENDKKIKKIKTSRFPYILCST